MNNIKLSWFNFNSKDHSESEDLSKKISDTLKNLPALKIINNEFILENTISKTNSFSKNKENIIVFGTGGSNLGSRALVNIAKSNFKNKIFFYDNIDPLEFESFLKKFDLNKVGFIIVSKSGSTPETLSQFFCLIEIFEKKNQLDHLYRNCLIITEDNSNPLRKIAEKNNCLILNHEKDIGGRYSIFSNVGIVPAIISGLDVKQIFNGAKSIYDEFLQGKYLEFTVLPNLFKFQRNTNFTNSVLITYSDSLYFFGKWYMQLLAESVGKQNKGITPIHSIGTTDQHSQLQLYLDGPKDKFFTFITTDHINKGLIINKNSTKDSGLEYLFNNKMGDLMHAEQKSTMEIFKKNGFIFREIHLPEINEFLIGQLICFYIMETISTCIYYNVNPFDQPAVEAGKNLTKKILNQLQ